MINLVLDKNGGINKGDINIFEGENKNEVYVIQLMKNDAAYNLANKTVELSIIEKKRKYGDVLSLPVESSTEGKVRLEIVSDITKIDGSYDFQLTVKDGAGLIDVFPSFRVDIKNNLISEIAGDIIADENFEILQQGLKNLADYNVVKENATKVPEIQQDITEIHSSLETNTNELIKETKKETTLSLLSSNVVIRGVKKVRTSTSFGSDFYFTNAQNTTIMNCDIESGSNGIIFGNEGYQDTPNQMKALFNKIKSNAGNRARNGKDGIINGEHDFFMNDIETVNTEVGIESWTGKTRVSFNRIINKNGTGGFSGITLGGVAHQKALYNYVNGFGAGIEIGNVKRGCIAQGNTIENCGIGISCSSNGKEKDVDISNNYISLKVDGYGVEITGSSFVNISDTIFEYESSDGSYGGYPISMKTNCDTVYVSNCTFINTKKVLTITNGYRIVYTNCKFINCETLSTGSPAYGIEYINCNFINCGEISATNNRPTLLQNCVIVQEVGQKYYNQPILNGRASGLEGYFILKNNRGINCRVTSLVSDADHPTPYNSRAQLEIRDTDIFVNNLYNSTTGIDGILTTLNITKTNGMFFTVWSTSGIKCWWDGIKWNTIT